MKTAMTVHGFAAALAVATSGSIDPAGAVSSPGGRSDADRGRPSRLEGPARRSHPDAAATFGTANAKPGSVARGVLKVPVGRDAGLDIPVTVVRGARPGPTIALIAGLHGAEYAGIVALQRLQAELDPHAMSGTIVIIPVVNTPGFEAIVRRVNPVDGKNMNRFFPGDPAGTQTERAADLLTREILSRVDAVIDYHGGDLDEDQIPYSYWIVNADAALVATERGMLAAFGLPYVIRFLLTETDPRKARLLPTQAVLLGKPAITVDAGRSGTYTEEDLRLLVDGTRRTLGFLGILPAQAPSPALPQRLLRTTDVDSPANGIFFPMVSRGEQVRKGARIGVVRSYVGDLESEVLAPEDAVILYRNSTAAAVQGEQLFFLGIPIE